MLLVERASHHGTERISLPACLTLLVYRSWLAEKCLFSLHPVYVTQLQMLGKRQKKRCMSRQGQLIVECLDLLSLGSNALSTKDLFYRNADEVATCKVCKKLLDKAVSVRNSAKFLSQHATYVSFPLPALWVGLPICRM